MQIASATCRVLSEKGAKGETVNWFYDIQIACEYLDRRVHLAFSKCTNDKQSKNENNCIHVSGKCEIAWSIRKFPEKIKRKYQCEGCSYLIWLIAKDIY